MICPLLDSAASIYRFRHANWSKLIRRGHFPSQLHAIVLHLHSLQHHIDYTPVCCHAEVHPHNRNRTRKRLCRRAGAAGAETLLCTLARLPLRPASLPSYRTTSVDLDKLVS